MLFLGGAAAARADDHVGRATRPLALVSGLEAAAPLAGQLALDLSMLGFAVAWGRKAPPEASEGPSVAARLTFFVTNEGRERLRIEDHLHGKSAAWDFPWRGTQTLEEARIASQRLVELLRASFRELAAAPRAPPQEPQAPAPAPRGNAWNATGGASLWGATDLPLQAGAWLGLEHLVTERWSLGVQLTLPLAAGRIEASEGRATSRLFGFLALATRRFGAATARVRPFAAAGVGLARLDLEGRANPPFVAVHDPLTRLWGAVQLGLALRLTHRASLVAAGTVASPGPAADIAFVDRTVARFGPVLAQLCLGGQLAF